MSNLKHIASILAGASLKESLFVCSFVGSKKCRFESCSVQVIIYRYVIYIYNSSMMIVMFNEQ